MRGEYNIWDKTWSYPMGNNYRTGKSRGVVALAKLIKNLKRNKIPYKAFEELQYDDTILINVVWNTGAQE